MIGEREGEKKKGTAGERVEEKREGKKGKRSKKNRKKGGKGRWLPNVIVLTIIPVTNSHINLKASYHSHALSSTIKNNPFFFFSCLPIPLFISLVCISTYFLSFSLIIFSV